MNPFRSLHDILRDEFYGFPQDRLEQEPNVRQLLRSKLPSLVEYMVVWCEFQQQQQQQQAPPGLQSVAAFCAYFGISVQEFKELDQQDMIQLSLYGFQNGVEAHVELLEWWTQQQQQQQQEAEQQVEVEQHDNQESCQISNNEKVSRQRRPVTCAPVAVKSQTTLTDNHEQPVFPLKRSDGKRTIKPKHRFDPCTHGRAWSNGKPAPKKPPTKKRPYKPRHFLMNRLNRGTIPGVYPKKNSQWKYIWRNQAYIVEVTSGRVSQQGKIEILWKGYGSTERVLACDLLVPTDLDFETFERDFAAAREFVKLSSSQSVEAKLDLNKL